VSKCYGVQGKYFRGMLVLCMWHMHILCVGEGGHCFVQICV
jgi:hypothetical protein